MIKPSLKAQITILLPIATCLVMLLLLLFAHIQFEHSIKGAISSQQFLTVSVLADDMDQKITSASQMISALADGITPEMLHNQERLLHFIKEHQDYATTFDNSLIVLDRSGRILAESSNGMERQGLDLSHREYFQKTMQQAAPYISEPYITSRQGHHPALMFTATIKDRQAGIIGVLGGSIDLTRPNAIGRVRNIRIGRNGYLYLFSEDRKMILHPDSSRIMKNDLPPGANQLLDRAIAGFEGTDETVNSRGKQMLTSFKHLKSKNWILAANLPLSEAYGGINRLNLIFFATSIPVLLSLFFSMRHFLRRMTHPLLDFTRHVEQLPEKVGSQRLYEFRSGVEEVDTLSSAFNQMISQLDRQQNELASDLTLRKQAEAAMVASEESLHRQNEYLLALHNTTLGLIGRLEINNLLKDIISRAAGLMNTEHAYIYLLDESTGKMVIHLQHGIFERFNHHPLECGEGMAGYVWKSGTAFHVDEYRRWPGRLPDPMRDVLRAMAGIPLRADGKIVGVIGLAYLDEQERFDEEKLAILDRFAQLASLALDNARLYAAAQEELAERTKAEENLRKLSHVVEQSPISIVITDLHGNIEYANPYTAQITGYELEEIKGKNPRLFKSGFTCQAEYDTLWRTIRSGREWRGEFHNRKKNGEYYWELALISPLRDQSGRTTHYIAIKEDITDRKKLENQLRHSQKMEAIGQLAGGIAHDFNNLLTAIIGYATILQMRGGDCSAKPTVEQILQAAERGTSLTQGLLAFSRKQLSNPSLVDLNEIIERAQRLLSRLIGEDILLLTQLCRHKLPLMADSIQIEQVLMNLSTNARDALPDGGTVSITTDIVTIDDSFVGSEGFGEPGSYALLTFTDNGGGMDEETVKRIFEPFFTTKETGKGTGLGLSIAYGVIKKHGGYITCHSIPDKGTTFRIYLPLKSEEPVQSAEQPEQGQSPGGQELILLAEDDQMMRDLTKELLEDFGYRVVAAADGMEALQIYREKHKEISLVILDAVMPGMKGIEVYREIKSINGNGRVLFCSGYSPAIIEQEVANLHFLAKPFIPKELLMKIREVLEDEN